MTKRREEKKSNYALKEEEKQRKIQELLAHCFDCNLKDDDIDWCVHCFVGYIKKKYEEGLNHRRKRRTGEV